MSDAFYQIMGLKSTNDESSCGCADIQLFNVQLLSCLELMIVPVHAAVVYRVATASVAFETEKYVDGIGVGSQDT